MEDAAAARAIGDAPHSVNPLPPLNGDPLVEIGRRLAELRQRVLVVDAATIRKPKPSFVQDDFDHTDDCEEHVRYYASTVKATSLQGAAFHLSLACFMLQLEDEAPTSSEYYRAQVFRAINRLLYSALDVIAALPGVDWQVLLDAELTHPRFNPWLSFEQRDGALRTMISTEEAGRRRT